ncbi:MAG: acetate/propionate family kinase [Polyangiaceae bacterium]|nr:acetate/propionate family kinase [Polyangiaceae bacterium]
MKILVLNCGSSSLKYRLIDMPGERELVSGEAQRVGPKTAQNSRIVQRENGREEVIEADLPDHASAFVAIHSVLARNPELEAELLAHRLVHGGALFSNDAFVDDAALGMLEQTLPLAPIHNPPAVRLIGACHRLFPELAQVAVFDTVYHATIAPAAREYALPRRYVAELGFRKYGFHGTSHAYVVERTAEVLGIPLTELDAVSCHLGSGGASLCAVVRGRSVDNTMGFSPLQGLVMSTRSGDLDPAVTLRLLARASGDTGAVDDLLNRKSGMLGLSGVSADLRDVLALAREPTASDDARQRRALDVYLWRLKKYLGAYLALVGSPRAIVFTDTIGELVPAVRWAVCSGLEVFGVRLDPRRNEQAKTLPAELSAPDSRVRVFAIATNEELAIARRSYALCLRPAA